MTNTIFSVIAAVVALIMVIAATVYFLQYLKDNGIEASASIKTLFFALSISITMLIGLVSFVSPITAYVIAAIIAGLIVIPARLFAIGAGHILPTAIMFNLALTGAGIMNYKFGGDKKTEQIAAIVFIVVMVIITIIDSAVSLIGTEPKDDEDETRSNGAPEDETAEAAEANETAETAEVLAETAKEYIEAVNAYKDTISRQGNKFKELETALEETILMATAAKEEATRNREACEADDERFDEVYQRLSEVMDEISNLGPTGDADDILLQLESIRRKLGVYGTIDIDSIDRKSERKSKKTKEILGWIATVIFVVLGIAAVVYTAAFLK